LTAQRRPVPDAPARSRALAAGGLIAMASAVGIGRFIYTPILPSMAEGLDLTQGEAGLIASANFAGYLAGALAAASPQLPASPRRWLLTALAASAVTTGAMGAAQGLALFLGLRFLGGAASAFVLVLASALVLERLSAAGRSDLSAYHFAGVGAGIALSALLTWGLTSVGGGWRSMWIGGGLISLAAFVAAALLVPVGRESSPSRAEATSAAEESRIWPLVIAYGLFGFGYVITATFIVALMRDSLAVPEFEPLVWFVVGLAAIPSVAAWSSMGRRYGVIPAFAMACLVEAVGVVSSVVWVSLAGLFVAAIFLGGTFMGITALGLMAARTLSSGDSRRVLAMMTAAFGLGQIIGPVVAGYAFDLTGSFLLPSMAAAAGLGVSAALATAVARR
jgi:predicted MFS family arabinose efflux permease